VGGLRGISEEEATTDDGHQTFMHYKLTQFIQNTNSSSYMTHIISYFISPEAKQTNTSGLIIHYLYFNSQHL